MDRILRRVRASPGVLAFALGACLTPAGREARAEDTPPPPPVIRREIRVRLACDEEWRAQSDWEAVARRRVEAASAVYEKTFGIRWQVADVVPWTSNDAVESLGDLLRQVERDVPRAGVDLALGFTNQTHALGAASPYELSGLARFYGPVAIVQGSEPAQRTRPERSLVSLIVHELAHVLGAWHCGDSQSYLWGEGLGSWLRHFDPQSAATIELTCDLDFARGVDWLDSDRRRRLGEIWRAGHAAGVLPPYLDVELGRARRTTDDVDVGAGRAMYRRILAEAEACAEPDDPALLGCIEGLARSLMFGAGQDRDEAERLAARALSLRDSGNRPDAETLMADLLWDRSRREEAIARYASASQALSQRLQPSDARRTRAANRLYARRVELFELQGRPAWTVTPWWVVPPHLPPSPTRSFAAPQEGYLHVRRADLAGSLDGRPLDPMSESLCVAAPVAGELIVEVREVAGAGRSPPPQRISVRMSPATGAAPGVVVEIRYVSAHERDTTEFAAYDGQIVVRPPVGAETVRSFQCKAPGAAALCLDRCPIGGHAGFIRLPFEPTLLRCRQWVGTTGEPALRFESDVAAFIDGARFTVDGTGAQRTWRLELTFVPEPPK